MRASQRDYLFAFKKYAKEQDCYYLNCFSGFYPPAFKNIKFDLVIFTWSFLDSRFMRDAYLEGLQKLAFIKGLACPKVMMPQDEFSHTDLLCETANFFNVDHIFSVSPESEWAKMYRTVDFAKVTFSRLLTGYLDDSLVKKIRKLEEQQSNRSIDVGYRSGSAVYWGRFNLIKFRLAEEFLKMAPRYNITLDISFGWNNFLMGDSWYKFLLNCRYIPGVEGGSSIMDWDGQLVDSVQSYLREHPGADYDEIEKNCIAEGKDGEIRVVALSPRHLEACLTKTCQILIEGQYNDILEPGIHYIELKADFSNLESILQHLKNEEKRVQIVNTAYDDIVRSGKYSYSAMVQRVLDHCSIGTRQQERPKSNKFLYWMHTSFDKLNIMYVYAYSYGRKTRDFFVAALRRK